MELSNLFTTILANLITWMNDATFKAIAINRVLSILGAWMMFTSSIISYRIFISGGDFGYFDKFYWSIILITFINGIFSNLSFGVNYNTSLYGAGVPSSGFVTFFIHYIYKGFYKIFYWEDYDYTLVIVQYLFTVLSLAVTGALWTWDQVLQMIEANRNDTLNVKDQHDASGVEIKIDQTNDYNSGDETVKVFLTNGTPSAIYTRYTHRVQGSDNNYKKIGTATFTNGGNDLKKIEGTSTPTAFTESNVKAVYVFYSGAMDIPIIICVEYESGTSHKYYRKDNPFFKWDDNWKDITGNAGSAVAGKIRKDKPPDSRNEDLKTELRDLTLPLIGILIAIMISIIFVSIMIGLIISKVSSKYYGVPVALVVYTALTITLSGGTGIGDLFATPQQLSPVLMLSLSLGTVYAFYPSISPYSLADPDSGKTIDLWIQFLSTLPTYAIAIMDTVDDGGTLKGPGGMFPGIWGEFIDNNGNNVKNDILDQLKVAEDKADDASWTTSEYKKANVLLKITDAIRKVEAIQTGADFIDTSRTPGETANTALTAVKSSADGISKTDFTTGGEEAARHIKNPIDEAKEKFESATTNGVGKHITPDKPANAKNWNAHGGSLST